MPQNGPLLSTKMAPFSQKIKNKKQIPQNKQDFSTGMWGERYRWALKRKKER